jgi:hypothetical protein
VFSVARQLTVVILPTTSEIGSAMPMAAISASPAVLSRQVNELMEMLTRNRTDACDVLSFHSRISWLIEL